MDNVLLTRRIGSIDSLAPLAHPSGLVYVARFPAAPFSAGTLRITPHDGQRSANSTHWFD